MSCNRCSRTSGIDCTAQDMRSVRVRRPQRKLAKPCCRKHLTGLFFLVVIALQGRKYCSPCLPSTARLSAFKSSTPSTPPVWVDFVHAGQSWVTRRSKLNSELNIHLPMFGAGTANIHLSDWKEARRRRNLERTSWLRPRAPLAFLLLL